MLRIICTSIVVIGLIVPAVSAEEGVSTVIRDLKTLDRHLPSGKTLDPKAQKAFEEALKRVTKRYYQATGSVAARKVFEQVVSSIRAKLDPATRTARPGAARPVTATGPDARLYGMVRQMQQRASQSPKYVSFERQGVYAQKDVNQLLAEVIRFGRSYRQFHDQYRKDLAALTQYQPQTEQGGKIKSRAIEFLRDEAGPALREEIESARTDIGQETQHWLSYVNEDIRGGEVYDSEKGLAPRFPIRDALQTAYDSARIGLVLEHLVGGPSKGWEKFKSQAEQEAAKRRYHLKERLVPSKPAPPATTPAK